MFKKTVLTVSLLGLALPGSMTAINFDSQDVANIATYASELCQPKVVAGFLSGLWCEWIINKQAVKRDQEGIHKFYVRAAYFDFQKMVAAFLPVLALTGYDLYNQKVPAGAIAAGLGIATKMGYDAFMSWKNSNPKNIVHQETADILLGSLEQQTDVQCFKPQQRQAFTIRHLPTDPVNMLVEPQSGTTNSNLEQAILSDARNGKRPNKRLERAQQGLNENVGKTDNK